MRLSSIIELGKRYLLLGVFLGVVFYIGYFVIYEKVMKGKKKIAKGKLCWVAVFNCYMIVVLCATVLDRENMWINGTVRPMFYSYKEAWNSFSIASWRNIILNILLFVPFGFLLPTGVKRFQKFWKTYLAGIFLTVCIELLQFVLKRGIFECDDIFNNTLGTMIGYGCYALVISIVSVFQKKKVVWKNIIVVQIPLLLAVGLFGSIFIVYANKELGNLQESYVVAYDKERLDVTSDMEYENEEGSTAVYRVPVFSEADTRKMAEEFFASLGTEVDESRIDIYDETAFYYDTGNHNMVIDYVGGVYDITDFETSFDENNLKKVVDADEATIRGVLEGYGITIPEGAEFSYSQVNDYQFVMEQVVQGEVMYNGTLSCSYYDNGKLGDIRNSIVKCEIYKEYDIISQQEAYEWICDGKFAYSGDGELNIELGGVELQYVTDSKAYYQPVWAFEATINGQETVIRVPALK